MIYILLKQVNLNSLILNFFITYFVLSLKFSFHAWQCTSSYIEYICIYIACMYVCMYACLYIFIYWLSIFLQLSFPFGCHRQWPQWHIFYITWYKSSLRIISNTKVSVAKYLRYGEKTTPHLSLLCLNGASITATSKNCVLLGHWVSLMSSLFQQHIKVHVKFIKPPQTGQLHTGLTGRPTVQVTVINNDITLRLPIRQRGGYQNLHVWDEHVVTEMANDSLLIKSTTS